MWVTKRLRSSPGKGIIAFSTLLITTILIILIGALLWSLSQESRHVLRYNHASEALYVAEAGIADATVQLSSNNGWKPTTPLVVPFSDGGKYTIVFYDGVGTVGANESVNNLNNTSTVDGPRGTATVPPRTADVVVVAEIRGQEVRYECLIARGLSQPISVPLLSSGKIVMKGAVNISGIESLSDPVSVEAGVHSNSAADQAGVISWDGQGNDAFISGKVTATSVNANAITATGGDFNAADVNNATPYKQFPSMNIQKMVDTGMTYATTMTPSAGGTTTLSGNDYRFSGGTVNGDLVLDGVNLYVDGDLEVVGSIRGNGSIYVSGDTSFRGSVELVSQDNTLALFSKGNVKLEGFDGSQYLDNLAATDPTFSTWNEDAKWAHEQLSTIVSTAGSYDPGNPGPTTWGGTDGNYFDELRAVLGDSTAVPTGRSNDALGEMANYLETNFSGNESADFLVQRLRDTREIYEADPGTGGVLDRVGLLDRLNGGSYYTQAQNGAAAVNLQNFDKLGTSYFQGLIYTNGAVYAGNEVEVVGALMAQKNAHSPSGSLSAGGQTLEPGDVFLGGGSSIVYNMELVEDPFARSPVGPVVVTSWLGE